MTNALPILEELKLVRVPAWWENPWVWVPSLLVLAVGLWLWVRWWRSRPVPVPPTPTAPPGPPPHLNALERLNQLRSKHSSLSAYSVALECSDILRSYIHERFAIPMRFQTTREFLGTALSDPLLTGDAQKELGDFLRFFDALKFARAAADPSATLATVDGTERFVRRCIPATGVEVSQ